MIEVIVSTLLQVLYAFLILTAIVFLIAISFAMLSGIKQIHEENKIKSENIRTLKQSFDNLIKSLNKEDQENK